MPRGSNMILLSLFRRRLGVCCLFCLLIFLCIFWWKRNFRHPILFLIPQGYVGWVRVQFSVKGASHMPRQNNYFLARIPNSGLLKTASPIETGWAADKFCYVTPSGLPEPLRSNPPEDDSEVWPGSSTLTYQSYFIGTKDQFMEAGHLIGGEAPGPIHLPVRHP